MVWKVPIPTNLEQEFGGNKQLAVFFMLLLLHATRETRMVQTRKGFVELQPGEVLCSMRLYAEYLGCSRNTVASRLQSIVETFKKADKRLTSHGTVVCIRSYCDLVGFEKDNVTVAGQGLTVNGPSTGQEQESKERKERKEEKEEKEEKEGYGIKNTILLSSQEYQKLCEIYENVDHMILELEAYLHKVGIDKYKNHYLTLLNRLKKDGKKRKKVPPKKERKTPRVQGKKNTTLLRKIKNGHRQDKDTAK